MRIAKSKTVGPNGLTYYFIVGTSDETKPIGEYPENSGYIVANGSEFFENDTGVRFEYNTELDSWYAVGQLPPATLIEKTITANNTYKAEDDSADGYSQVTVNVPPVEFSATPESFSLITNIRDLSLVVPNGITNIGGYSFQDCIGLKSITIPDSVTTIGNYAFYRCAGLVDVNIDASINLSSFNAHIFNGCTSLKNIVIPSSVTSIGAGAFQNCTSLKNIAIPASVTSIGASCFSGCSALEAITIDKAEGSISGAPWGAPSTAQIIWTGGE